MNALENLRACSRGFCRIALIGLALWPAGLGFLWAQEEPEAGDEGRSLGDLLKGFDLKVPDSVSKFTEDLVELKESYLETAENVQTLRDEVAVLREEVEQLRLENTVLRKQLEEEATNKELNTAVIALTATDLAGAYANAPDSADDRYLNNYVTIAGRIKTFMPGSGEITIFLNAHREDFQVRCVFRKDDTFNVEALPHQGRLISLPDRRTMLQVGQPVVISGTCVGKELDILMVNCRLDNPKLSPAKK